MTFWLFNDLVFDSPGKQQERQRRAEKKRQEKIKQRRSEERLRQAEFDKLREAAGMGAGNTAPSQDSFDDEVARLIKQHSQQKEPSKSAIQVGALSKGFGGAQEVKTGYKHGHKQSGPQFGPQSPATGSQNPATAPGAFSGKLSRPY